MKIRILTKKDCQDIVWPNTESAKLARDWIVPLMDNTSSYISNIEVELYLLKINDLFLPVSKSDTSQIEQSYVVSPRSMLLYAREELERHSPPFVGYPLRPFFFCLDYLFQKAQMDKVVMINNWLLSTNLYPKLSLEETREIHQKIRSYFPQYAIMWRTLSSTFQKDIMGSLEECGYHGFVNRQFYFYEQSSSVLSKKRGKKSLQRDRNLKEKSSYEVFWDDGSKSFDYKELCCLYKKLYIEKYSSFNPQFTEKIIELWHRTRTMSFLYIEKDNVIYGIAGYWHLNKMMTVPLFGYETKLAKNPFYRLLTLALTDHFFPQNFPQKSIEHYNLSSGVGQFKRHRGAMVDIEYSFVYFKKMSLLNRLCWKILIFIANCIVKPIMVWFKL